MCESTVFVERGGEEKELMRDAAKLEVTGKTITCIDIMGVVKTVQGTLKTADLMNHKIIISAK